MSQIHMLLLLYWIVKGTNAQENIKLQKYIFSIPLFQRCNLKVFVSGKPGTQVTAESDGTRIETIEIGATKGGSIELPNTVCYSQSETVSQESVQLSASDDIFAVVSMEAYKKDAEAVALLPVTAFSQTYFVVTVPSTKESSGYRSSAALTIAALTDNTTVTISLKLTGACSTNSNLSNGGTVIKLLNRYDAYGIFCDSDMMGTVVESSSPIALLSGRALASIPLNSSSVDTIFHMMPPVELYGTEFVLHNLAHASALYRAVAAYTNTNVSWGNHERTLQPGDHFDIDTAVFGETCLTSTMPILVVVFYKSGTSLPWQEAGLSMDYGDPFMTVVQTTHQFKKSYLIPYVKTTRLLDYTAHISLVLSSAEDKTSVTELLDSILGVTYEENLVCNRFSLFTFQPTEQATVSMELPYNFGVMFFGIGNRAGLGYSGNTFATLSPLTFTSAAVSTTQITSTLENLIVTTQLTSITLTNSMIQSNTNTTTTQIQITASSFIMADTLTMMVSPNLTSGGSFTTSLITSTSNNMIITPPVTDTSNLPMLITSTIVSSTAVKEFISTYTSMVSTSSTVVSHPILTQSSSYISIPTAIIIPTMTMLASSTSATATLTTTVAMRRTSTTTTTTTTSSTTTSTTPVLLDKNGQPVRTVSRKCSCFCKNKDRLDVYTEEAATEAKKKIKDGLIIKTSNLAKAVAKKTSATDKRSSASTIGWLGIGLMVLSVLFIVGVDLLNICSYRKSGTQIHNKNEDQNQEANEDLDMNHKPDIGLDPDTNINQGDSENNIDLDFQ